MTHPKTFRHQRITGSVARGAIPESQLSSLEASGGVSMATKWYWALDIGAIEAISASDRHSARVPDHDRRNPYIKDTGPPFRKPAPIVLISVSQAPSDHIS